MSDPSPGPSLRLPRHRRISARHAPAAFAVIVGLAAAVSLIGRAPLNPTDISWIFGDNGTYYSAWEQYRHDPHLHFPLSWTERIGYPVGTSIALLDAIPIMAVALRPLSPLLPVPFQYLGIWIAICFVLQAYFGVSLCRRLFGESPVFCLLGSVLFVLALPLTDRVAGHTALVSQWLILAMLDAYFRDATTPMSWMSRIWIVLALSAATTPYIAAMCFLVALAAVLRLTVERRCGWIATLAFAVGTVAVVAASGVAFGAIVTGDAKAHQAAGYGLFSWNLNALVNPMSRGSILLPPLPLAHRLQYEGYSYLGLGVLALIAAGLARNPRALYWLGARRVVPLTVLALGCAAVAASNTVTLNSRTLFTLPLSPGVLDAFSALRASGRLVWPAYYIIYLGALALTFRTWRPRYRNAVLAIAVAVQFADEMPMRRQIRSLYDNRFPSPLAAAAWQNLGTTYDNLILVPAFQCQAPDIPGGYYSFVHFGKIAAQQKMRLNSYYAARYTDKQLQAHCVDLPRRHLLGDVDPRSAYVVSDGVRTLWGLNGVSSLRCAIVDGFNLCTPGTPESGAATTAVPAAYTLGTSLDFNSRDAKRYLTLGWLDPAPGGTWTQGPVAMLRLGLDPADRAGALDLTVDASPFLSEVHNRLDVAVVVNGAALDKWTFNFGNPETVRQVRIPAAVVAARTGFDIEFRVENPAAPMYAGGGADMILKGFALRSLVVTRAR